MVEAGWEEDREEVATVWIYSFSYMLYFASELIFSDTLHDEKTTVVY